MSRFYRKITKKVGISPGTLLPSEDKKVEKVRLTLFDYDKDRYDEKELESIEEGFPFKDKPTVTWLNIDGLHEVKVLEKLGHYFNIHPLVLEDILNTAQRPKMENYDDYIYIVLRMLNYHKDDRIIHGEQISIIIGGNFVISFQEREGDVFDILRQRIRNNESRLRSRGTDYLAYRILDTVVDHYFIILERIGEDIEELEAELMENPSQDTLEEIHRLKREMIFLRKSIWPLREVISGLTREDTKLVENSTEVFLRDVYDHIIQVVDTVENFRDMVSGMLDIYLSSVSNRMNEVMKILTIMASIFIPLTFIAGIYGMNFKFMPELEWRFGYAMVWIAIVLISASMVVYFKKKKWL